MADINVKANVQRTSTLGKVRILVEQVVGSPSQAQISQAVADYIDNHPGALSPLSQATKSALLDIAEHVAYIDANGQSYYNALDAALNAKALLSIMAVYTQSGTVYDTDSLDSLKADLVVTAYYDDGTSAVISSGYTLSGTLDSAVSTITVTFEGKTAAFNVNVTSVPVISWDYTLGRLPSADDGITTTENGSTATFDSTKGLHVNQTATSSTNYVRFEPTAYLTAKHSIFEAVFTVVSQGNGGQLQTRLSNGATGANVSFVKETSSTVYKLISNETSSSSPTVEVQRVYVNTEYKLKVEFEYGVETKIYLNDALVRETTHFSTYYTTANRLYITGPNETYVKSIKWTILEA